jgi:hypothetical protein
MRHEAILDLYSSAVTVRTEDGQTVAYDADGNVVAWDESAVAAKEQEIINEINLSELRKERNKRLSETDYYGLSDQAMSQEMSNYRQSLRDITDNYNSLDNVVWPEKP